MGRLITGIGRRGSWLAWLAAGIAISAALAPFLGQLHPLSPTLAWLLGLLGHWQWVLQFTGLLGALLAVACGRTKALLPAAIMMGTWFLHLPEAASPQHPPVATTDVLRVATLNLNYENNDLQRLGQWVQAKDAPDILLLEEFTPVHQHAIEVAAGAEWERAYPYRSLHPQPDQFGIAVLSRWPIRSVQEIAPQSIEDTLKLHLMIDWKERPVAVAAIHPMPPINQSYAMARDRSLLSEARRLAQLDVPGILLGDFNDTPWSSGMRALAPYLSRASGLTPTWPNAYGRLSLLPLDHVLVSRHWTKLESRLGADVGSDHRPVMASISLKP